MANVLSYGVVPGTYGAAIGIESNSREIEYVITFDAPVYSTDEVLLVPSIPFPGTSLDDNQTMYCTGISILPEANNQCVWRIRAQYDSSGIAIKEGLAYDFRIGVNPISKAARGAYWFSKTTKKPGSDIQKEATIPIENSAGDPFAEPVTTVQSNTVISWWQVETIGGSRNILNGSTFQMIGTVNLEDETACAINIPAGAGLIKNIEPELYQYRPPNSTTSLLRFKTRYTVEISADGSWVDSILDQGYNAFLRKSQTDSTKIKRPIKLSDLTYNQDGNKVKKDDANDDFINTAVKLDGNGEILGDEEDPVYMNYLVKKMTSWKTLDLAKTIATPDIAMS